MQQSCAGYKNTKVTEPEDMHSHIRGSEYLASLELQAHVLGVC